MKTKYLFPMITSPWRKTVLELQDVHAQWRHIYTFRRNDTLYSNEAAILPVVQVLEGGDDKRPNSLILLCEIWRASQNTEKLATSVQ